MTNPHLQKDRAGPIQEEAVPVPAAPNRAALIKEVQDQGLPDQVQEEHPPNHPEEAEVLPKAGNRIRLE